MNGKYNIEVNERINSGIINDGNSKFIEFEYKDLEVEEFEIAGQKLNKKNIETILGDNKGLDKSKLEGEESDEEPKPFNNQESSLLSINYTDMVIFKLLISDKDKLIDRTQDLIVANKELQGNYENNNLKMEVTVENSDVNVFFKVPSLSGEDGKHKFNGFKFSREYN